MKKYNISEVLLELKQHNTKIFKNMPGPGGPQYVLSVDNKGWIVAKESVDDTETTGVSPMWFNVNDEWEEVRTAVSFKDVLKSDGRVSVDHKLINSPCASENKSFRLTLNKLSVGEYLPLDKLLVLLGNLFYPEEIREILLTGDWYIE